MGRDILSFRPLLDWCHCCLGMGRDIIDVFVVCFHQRHMFSYLCGDLYVGWREGGEDKQGVEHIYEGRGGWKGGR